jgi:hypothetical protein
MEGAANRFITQQALRHALLITHFRRQSQRPHPCGFAIEARRLMQEMLEAGTAGGIKHRCDGLGAIRLLPQALHALGVKSMDNVTDGLDGTAHQLRNGLRGQPPGTRKDDLGPSNTEGVCHAAVGFQLPGLIIGQGSDKKGWFHSLRLPRETPLHKNSCGDALVEASRSATDLRASALSPWYSATSNGPTEGFNGTVRDECLHMHVFQSVAEARVVLAAYRRPYHAERPHSSLG